MSELLEQLEAARDEIRDPYAEGDADVRWERLEATRKKRRMRPVALAAVALLAAGATWMALPTAETRVAETAPEVSAPVETANLRFADGSTVVYLEGGTEVVPEEVTDHRIRLALIDGAARFEVAPDREREFLVGLDDAEVLVVGTRFVVRRLEGQRMRVEVEEGRVRVRHPGEPGGVAWGEVYLIAGESFESRTVMPEPEQHASTRHERSSDPQVSPGLEVPEVQEREVEAQVEELRVEVEVAEPEVEGEPEITEHEVEEPSEEPRVEEPRGEEPRGEEPRQARRAQSERRWTGLVEAGEFEEAYEAMLEEGVREDDVGDLLLAADAARYSGHREEAVGFLRRVQRFPEDPRASLGAFTLGRVLLRVRPHEAAENFGLARRLDPEGSLAEDALAREVEAWYRAGRFERAQELAREYVERWPNGLRTDSVRRFGRLASP